MAETVNISVTGKRKYALLPCALQCGSTCKKEDSIENISEEKWIRIKEKASLWKGLDKFGDVLDTINWDNGPKSLFMHNSCIISLYSSRHLAQAHKRFEDTSKMNTINEYDTIEDKGADSNVLDLPTKKICRSNIGVLHDKNLCVWCMYGLDEKHNDRGKTKLFLICTYTAWYRFKQHIMYLRDEKMRERITRLIDSTNDPFATEIRYHVECWKKYVTYKFVNTENIHVNNVSFRDAQNVFFSYVQNSVFEEYEIRTLQSLLCDYKRIIGDFGYNAESIKSSYVKDILSHEFEERIGFKSRSKKNLSDIVYSKIGGESYLEAAITSHGISDEQLFRNAACRLKEKVSLTPTIVWPSYINELEEDEKVSEFLLQFLTWLRNPSSEKIDHSPTILTLASLLTKFITRKRTTFTINLSVTLHGLTKNKELVETLHNCGIGISYTDILMLHDFWTLQDLKESPLCPYEIVNDHPAIVIVDNDDFKVDSLTGSAVDAHRTNVMFVQRESLERKRVPISTERVKDPCSLSTSLRSLTSELERIPPYELKKTCEPPLRSKPDINLPKLEIQRNRSLLHTLIRSNDNFSRPSPSSQDIPMFNGFHSCISPIIEKSKPYYQMTYPVPPSKSVCYNVMQKLNQVMEDKNIPFIILVGDFPTFVYFLNIKSENGDSFNKIFLHLGPFHMHKSYLHAINKRFQGSGLSDILVAADALVSGSVEKALKGEHYRRALRGHFLLREALNICALQQSHFKLDDIEMDKIHKLRNFRDFDRVSSKQNHDELVQILAGKINIMFEDIKNSKSDMADFWLSYCKLVDILMMNVYALHSRNWKEFLSSMYEMLPVLKIYDNDKYGKILPDHWATLATLPNNVSEFMSNHFAESMTGNPYTCQPLDLWIECCMNKGSKMKAGWLSILKNAKQLMTNTRSPNNINRVRSALQKFTDKKKSKKTYTECTPFRLKIDEQVIQDLVTCLNEFGSNPFDLSSPKLRTLESGIVASSELLNDLQTALQDGKILLDTFLNTRVYSKEISLFDTVKRNKRKNFSKELLENETGGCENKRLQMREMESKALSSLLSITENDGQVQMENLFNHRITQESLPIFNVNGTFRKTQKSKLKSNFTYHQLNWPNDYVALIDMGMMLRKAIPTADDQLKLDGSYYTWNDYAKKCIQLVTSRHKFAKLIICVNDPYEYPENIKDEERELRKNYQGQIPNIFMKPGDKFPNAKTFKKITSSAANKTRIQNLIKNQFKNLDIDSEIVWSVGPICENLTRSKYIKEFECNQAEADTIIISIYSKIRELGEENIVVIDTEDTDIYVQSAYVSHHINGILCIRQGATHISCKSLCTEEISSIIIPLHAISGCDSNSGFFGHGKNQFYKSCCSHEEARLLLHSCGLKLPLQNDDLDNMKKFIIKYIYGDTKSKTLTQSRICKWKSQKKKSFSRLPPDNDALELHCLRANYLSFIQKNYTLLNHPSPIGNGWILDQNNKCRSFRYRLPEMPSTLMNLNAEIGFNHDQQDDDAAESNSSSDSDGEMSENDL